MKRFYLDDLPPDFPKKEAICLYKFEGMDVYRPELPTGEEEHVGLVVDVETNTLEGEECEAIEICVLPFKFSSGGEILRVGPPYVGFQEPISADWAKVEAITGITIGHVKGQSFNDDRIKGFFERADLAIAHHAEFDRNVIEKACGVKDVLWACSFRDIPWSDYNISAAKLEYLAFKVGGFYYDAHRAEMDCRSTLHLLSHEVGDVPNRTAFQVMLERAMTPFVQVFAHDSPFQTKDRLRDRGYRWNGDKKTWWTEIPEAIMEDEERWLMENVYWNDKQHMLRMVPVDLEKRFKA